MTMDDSLNTLQNLLWNKCVRLNEYISRLMLSGELPQFFHTVAFRIHGSGVNL